MEDNSLNREIATVLLEETGAVVEEAEKWPCRGEYGKNSSPGYYDLVFMDIQMPVMNGYDSTRHIRALNVRYQVHADNSHVCERICGKTSSCVKDSGMNEHIAKPIDFGRFLRS